MKFPPAPYIVMTMKIESQNVLFCVTLFYYVHLSLQDLVLLCKK